LKNEFDGTAAGADCFEVPTHAMPKKHEKAMERTKKTAV